MSFVVSRRPGLISAGTFLVALLLGLLLAFFLERSALHGRVPRGIESGGVSLSGARAAQLPRLLEEQQKVTNERSIVLHYEERRLEVSAGELGISLDENAIGKNALTVASRQGSFAEFRFFLARLFKTTSIPSVYLIDTPALETGIQEWTRKFLVKAPPPRIFYKGVLRGEEPRPSRSTDLPALKTALRLALKSSAPIEIELPVLAASSPISQEKYLEAWRLAQLLISESITVVDSSGEKLTSLQPQTLGAALSSRIEQEAGTLSLHLDPAVLQNSLKSTLKEVERPVIEASFDIDRRGGISVEPSEAGLTLDQELLARRLLEPQVLKTRRLELPLVAVEPRLSTEKAEELGIQGLVASFTTSHACCQPRVENIHTAAAKMDGHVILPGERFSLNQFLGPRIGNRDYKKAPTIVHGKMKKTSGGGISQFATTLFNAVLNGGYAIIQRQPHSFYFPRYPEGHEATISFPEPDLIFQNDTKAGLLVKTQFSGTYIKVSLYGDNGGRKVTRHKSKRFDLVKAETEYEPDPEMDPEKSKRRRAGQDGWTINVSRVIRFPDGTERKEQRDVVYKQRPQLLRVHPCMIPEGAKGHTGEECPEPEREEREEELSEDEYYETVPVLDEEEGD